MHFDLGFREVTVGDCNWAEITKWCAKGCKATEKTSEDLKQQLQTTINLYCYDDFVKWQGKGTTVSS